MRSPSGRHSREGGSLEDLEETGFPPESILSEVEGREWQKSTFRALQEPINSEEMLL